jgi:hypothetical protein
MSNGPSRQEERKPDRRGEKGIEQCGDSTMCVVAVSSEERKQQEKQRAGYEENAERSLDESYDTQMRR